MGKTFQIQLLRSARSTRLKPRPIAFNLVTENKAKTFGNTRNFSVTARRKTEDDDEMAPKGQKFELKTPKGTKDWEGKDMVIRDKIFSTITDVFKRHGAVTIDT